jgi:hypothetical protein
VLTDQRLERTRDIDEIRHDRTLTQILQPTTGTPSD